MKQVHHEFLSLIGNSEIDTRWKLDMLVECLKIATGETIVNWDTCAVSYLPSLDLMDYMKSFTSSFIGISEDCVADNGISLLKAIEKKEKEINFIVYLCAKINDIPSKEARYFFLRRYYFESSLREINLLSGYSNNKMYHLDSIVCTYFEQKLFGISEKRVKVKSRKRYSSRRNKTRY